MWTYKAIVKKIVDADTVDLSVDLGFKTYRVERFRLSRIDAWEVRGKEKFKGKKAKVFVEEQIPVGSEVTVQSSKQGKYGRYLGEIIYEHDGSEVNLGDRLLEEGHAVLYGSK